MAIQPGKRFGWSPNQLVRRARSINSGHHFACYWIRVAYSQPTKRSGVPKQGGRASFRNYLNDSPEPAFWPRRLGKIPARFGARTIKVSLGGSHGREAFRLCLEDREHPVPGIVLVSDRGTDARLAEPQKCNRCPDYRPINSRAHLSEISFAAYPEPPAGEARF